MVRVVTRRPLHQQSESIISPPRSGPSQRSPPPPAPSWPCDVRDPYHGRSIHLTSIVETRQQQLAYQDEVRCQQAPRQPRPLKATDADRHPYAPVWDVGTANLSGPGRKFVGGYAAADSGPVWWAARRSRRSSRSLVVYFQLKGRAAKL